MAIRPAPLIACMVATWLVACSPTGAPPTDAQVLAAGPDARWYRGNLHTHTLWSDGNELPDTVVGWYRDNGYHFLALTEHDLVPSGERWVSVHRRPPGMPTPAGVGAADHRHADGGDEFRLKPLDELEAAHNIPGSFLLLRGEEISDAVGPVSVHINALNLANTIEPARRGSVDETIAADLAAIDRQGRRDGRNVLAQLNHPNFTYSITAEHLMRLPGTAFFEVYNGHPLSNNPGDGLRASSESLWDIALSWRLDVLGLPMLYATATDDSHHYQPDGDAAPGRGWIEVLSGELGIDALFNAMRAGRFYATTGVKLKRIVATQDRLEVEVDPEPGVEYLVEFIGTRRGFDPSATPPRSATGRPIYASHRYDRGIGTVFARRASTRATYHFRPDDLYVRARITASRPHHAPSQPLQFAQAWVQPLTGPAGRSPSRPDLQPPAAPPALLHQGITRRFQRMDVDESRLLSTAAIPCAVDSISDILGMARSSYPARGSIALSGWIADPARARVPGSFAVVLDGEHDYIAEDGTGRRRQDLVTHFGHPRFENAGFHSTFELSNVARGDYRVRLVGFSEGKPASCDSGKTLRVS